MKTRVIGVGQLIYLQLRTRLGKEKAAGADSSGLHQFMEVILTACVGSDCPPE